MARISARRQGGRLGRGYTSAQSSGTSADRVGETGKGRPQAPQSAAALGWALVPVESA